MGVADEQRSRRPSTSADLVPAIEEIVHANCQVLLKELEEQFNLSHGTHLGHCSRTFRAQKSVQQVGPSTTGRGPQENPYGCIPHSSPLL